MQAQGTTSEISTILKRKTRERKYFQVHICGDARWLVEGWTAETYHKLHLSPSGRRFRLTSQNFSSDYYVYWSRHRTPAMHNPAHDTSQSNSERTTCATSAVAKSYITSAGKTVLCTRYWSTKTRQSSPVSPRPGRSETTVTVIERSRDSTHVHYLSTYQFLNTPVRRPSFKGKVSNSLDFIPRSHRFRLGNAGN